jgi:hypothetical protein
MKLLITLLLLALTLSASADVYTVRQSISDRELMDLYTRMLVDYSRYAEGQWHTSTTVPDAGYWGNGISDGNEGIRAVSDTALAYAALAKKTGALDVKTRDAYRGRAIAGIRYIVRTHLTGDRKCVNGKQWGASWQSSMWTGTTGFAAWMLWDDMDADLRKSVEQVVVFEANRFLDRKPPGRESGDTKAEENGWDQTCISLAAAMFPQHPNAAKWKQKSIEYMMNTVSVRRDLKDTTIVDRRPVKDWMNIPNYYPDFTLENHGIFHPSYTMVSPAEVGQGALFYAYAGLPIPQAAGHNLKQNWALLQTIMLPHGYWAYTQGMDWALNSDGHTHYLAFLSGYLKDPLAHGMEKIVAQYVRGHQLLHGGRFAGPASHLGFAREAITAERIVYSLMLHQTLGFPEPERTIRDTAELEGVHKYNFVDVMSHRTDSKFASFSWKNQIMGVVMPIGAGHEGSPFFTTPLTNGLVGSFVVSGGKPGGPKVIGRVWSRTLKGFQTSGTMLINGGALEHRLLFASIGEKTVVYADRVTAMTNLTITRETGVPVGIENDEFTGDQRVLYHAKGSQTITGPGTEAIIRIPGKWANVDGRLGMVVVQGSGLVYQDIAGYNRDGARQDFLYGSFSDNERKVKAGQEVARRVVVLYAETSPQDTAQLAEQARIEKTPSGSVLHIALPEGGEYQIKL